MKKRLRSPGMVIAIAVVLVAGGAAAWFLLSPLFIDKVVQEEFPGAIPAEEQLMAMPEAEREKIKTGVMAAAARMPAKSMNDLMPKAPADQPEVVARGELRDGDSSHKGSGRVMLYRLPGGTHLLRLEGINVTNGPALHVLLAEAARPTNRAEVQQGYLDLGRLKGNIGSQNYEFPASEDVSRFKSVVIYCMPFHVVFSTATLN